MIKILEPGTKKITRCESCGCKFSYDIEDVKVFEEPGDYSEFIQCPQCKAKVTLEPHNLQRRK